MKGFNFYRKHPLSVMRQALANERGAGLVIALLALVVLSVLGLAFITISKTESDISYNDRDSGRSLYIADAGLERFKRDLRYDCTYPADGATPMNTSLADQYLASPAPAGDGTLEDTTGTYVRSTAPVKRYYNLGSGAFPTVSSEPPTASFWSSVSPVSAYLQTTLNGGSYTLKLAKSSTDAIYALSTGTVGSRVSRTLEAKFEAKNLSVWDNAVFGGTGASGAMINGNVTIAGSVHILGTGLSSSDTVMTLGGGATILNRYTGISSTLNSKLVQNSTAIDALPGKLGAEFRVKRGKTSINSNSSGVGESSSKVKAVYTNDGFAGTFPGNVYSDNGKNMKYDLPSDLNIPFPSPDTAWLDANSLDITASLPEEVIDGVSYRKLNADTPSFSRSSGGNSISWNPAIPGPNSGTLTLSGVFKVSGNLMLAKQNKIVLYSGKGTLYATGDVNIHDCVLPADAASFPSTNSIGIIATDDIDIDSDVAQVRHCGAFYAQDEIKCAKQDQIAGAIVANYFNMGNNVPSIYQVPLLGENLPPGMPGSDSHYFIKTVYWREVTS